MYRYLFLIISSILISSEISNIQVSQRQDGSGIVDICYDLIEDEGIYPSFEVGLQISFDGGQTFSTVSASDLSGGAGSNVIPGNGICMQYQAQSEIFSNQAQVKITASSSYVSSQLPFSMVNIQTNSNNQNIDYEGESINYDYEMMQFELTNIDLVTWLETYSFDLTNGAPIYDCSEFSNFYNENPNQAEIAGCQDEIALNYNPNATYDNGDCIYPDQGVCTDVNAANYDQYDQPDMNDTFDDCSCSYLQVENSELVGNYCDFICLENGGSLNEDGSGGAPDSCNWQGVYFEGLGLDPFDKNTFSGCGDPSAINYIGQDFLTQCEEMQSGWEGYSCCTFQSNPSSCVYECDYDYSHLTESDDDRQVSINDFQTQHISYEGSSFLIDEGKGNYPVVLNSQSCVDGIVAKLFMDYYGLRIPTAGEWMKAAREDDQSCWPWISGTCESLTGEYCQGLYSITSEEQLATCQSNSSGFCFENCENSIQSCESSCSDGYYECLSTSSDPDCSGGPGGEPSDYLNCECESQLYGCDSACEIEETECVEGCQGLPEESECYDIFSAYLTCSGNGDTLACDEIDLGNSLEQDGLLWYLSEQSEDYYANLTLDQDNAMEFFNQSIFYNRFHLADCGDDCGLNPLNVIAVGQYPMGQSSLGLYDMIGNAPEVVMYNEENGASGLYTLSHTPNENPFRSFCATDGLSYSAYNHSAASLMSANNGDYSRFYGLRLARTLGQ